jgi:hypothetical protein
MTGDSPTVEFDYRQPFNLDHDDAAEIAEFLRRSGYPGCCASQVTAELAKPERERRMIGLIAAGMLQSAGWWL